ncbi:phospholipid scramblase 1 [Aplysia californica]|uniref:Phospholipid scramblase n=1 Tax=Aplysia californica TaxID=6500 RepID=A0ABM0JKC7_APLCA|nr:phospholipid scramblase 1 [Aplysia californica]
MAVAKQPGENFPMMPHPGAISGVPTGLEYLTQVDQLICKQIVELFEVLTGWECKNKYRIMNSLNQQVFYAFEESGTCHRLFCGSDRGFTIHITDNFQQEVLRIERPFLCCRGCCWCAEGCCKYPVYIKDREGNQLGTVGMMNSCCKPHFGVYDNDENLIYEMWGPLCPCQCVCGCTGDVKFPVTNVKDNTTVGNISKIWDGAFKDCCTKADTFGITFPMNMDVKHKALLIGAVFVIDFMIFETEDDN